MYRFGYLFSQLIVLVPMLAIVVVGVVLAIRRRAVIGGRRAGFALAGLALVALHLLAGAIWSAAFPSLVSSLDMGASEFGVLVSVVSIMMTILLVAGVALLLAAALSRGNRPAGGPADHQGAYPQGGRPPHDYQPGGHQQGGDAQPGHSPGGHPPGSNVHSGYPPADAPQTGNRPDPDAPPAHDSAYRAPTGDAAQQFYRPPRPDPAQPPHASAAQPPHASAAQPPHASADRPAGTPEQGPPSAPPPRPS